MVNYDGNASRTKPLTKFGQSVDLRGGEWESIENLASMRM